MRAPLGSFLVLALAAATPLLGTGTASAASSDLDPTFGTGGEVATAFAGPADVGDMELTPHRILVAGAMTPAGGRSKVALARYRMNGGLDPAFGNGGRVVTGVAGRNAAGAALVVLPDGRFVVGVDLRDGNGSVFGLVRYHQDGSIDASFGNGGRVVEGFGGGRWHLTSLIRQPNGKLVAGGERVKADPTQGQVVRFAVARFAKNGSLDGSFGDGGRVVTTFRTGQEGADLESSVTDLVIDVSGRIVAVGWTSPDLCRSVWALARYMPDGSLDPSFGGDGRVSTRFWHINARAQAVQFGDDNRLTVAGSNTFTGCGGEAPPDTGTAAVARYLPDGRLDPSFGGDGKVTTTFLGTQNSDAGYEDLTLLEGGSVVATGSAFSPSADRLLIIVGQYRRGGALNTAFSDDGRATAAGPLKYTQGVAVSADPDERPIVAGPTRNDQTGRFLVARFKASG